MLLGLQPGARMPETKATAIWCLVLVQQLLCVNNSARLTAGESAHKEHADSSKVLGEGRRHCSVVPCW